MACEEFEDRLLDYAALAADERRRLDFHLTTCAECREFLNALHTVDSQLTAQFAGRAVSAGFADAVRRRVRQESASRRPSFIPELLDFVGWGAIVALFAMMIYWIEPQIPAASANAIWISAAAFLMTGVLVALHSFADLKH